MEVRHPGSQVVLKVLGQVLVVQVVEYSGDENERSKDDLEEEEVFENV